MVTIGWDDPADNGNTIDHEASPQSTRIAAYVILPRVVRMGLKILQRKSVPSFTLTGDGLPGDPVNLALIGEFERLRAVARAGWIEANERDEQESLLDLYLGAMESAGSSQAKAA